MVIGEFWTAPLYHKIDRSGHKDGENSVEVNRIFLELGTETWKPYVKSVNSPFKNGLR